MGKWKRLAKEHDEAIFELCDLLTRAYMLVQDGRISNAEFVGNLECVKYMAIQDRDEQCDAPKIRVMHVGGDDIADADKLIAKFFKHDDDKEEDRA